jgi:hypothetical protein
METLVMPLGPAETSTSYARTQRDIVSAILREPNLLFGDTMGRVT